MDDLNVPIFSQAKLEYTKQLVDVLYMNMYDGIRSIYDDAKILHLKQRKPLTNLFRNLLEQVPKWNTDIIESETERIEKTSKCDWLDDLLTAVFISHTRILMSIGSNQNFNRINVTIPKTTTFVHKSYINIAREVWKNPYLFDENIPGHEYQRNMKQLEDMIKLTIEDTIRRQLPIKEILKEHLENYDEPKKQNIQPFDMKTLVEELRKANINSSKDTTTNYDSDNNDDDGSDDGDGNDGDDDNNTEEETKPNLMSLFNKEEDIPTVENEESTENIPFVEESDTQKTSYNQEPDMETQSEVSQFTYNDPDDPDENQIKQATQNIVLNDITEPVIEEKYDNTDIVSPVKSSSSTNKLEDMIKELTMDNTTKESKISSVIKIDKVDDSNKPTLNPDISDKSKNASVPTVPSITKLDTPVEPNQSVDNKPDKKQETKSPFSFDSLYSSITGLGKVEDITETKPEETKPEEKKPEEKEPEEKEPEENKPEENKPEEKKPKEKTEDKKPNTIVIKDNSTGDKDINAEVMKEVISLDKKEEQIDETQTLDNFFTDIQSIANPTMEPIKEETKYTLFEDANASE